jgi:outer membrane protein assembly factor BamB
MGRGSKGMQFEDCYVFCLDLNSGKQKWMTYVASANIAGQFWGESFGLSQQSVSHLAYASGRVFCLTNLGAVAAINAYDGTIAWLNIYPREAQDMNALRMGIRQNLAPRKPWSFNPVIVSDQRVFILPGDGKNLHVYDAGSGKELRSLSTLLRTDHTRLNEAQSAAREQINMLIGVAPGTGSGDIVVGTDRSIMRVDWQTFEPLAERPPGVRWKTPIQPPNIAAARDPSMVRDPSQATTIRGRPFLSAESVFVPSAWQLVTISLRNGLRTQVYPTDRAWGDDEETGNVLATSEYLIVAGPTRVSAYTDMEMAIRRLAFLPLGPSSTTTRQVGLELIVNLRPRPSGLSPVM